MCFALFCIISSMQWLDAAPGGRITDRLMTSLLVTLAAFASRLLSTALRNANTG